MLANAINIRNKEKNQIEGLYLGLFNSYRRHIPGAQQRAPAQAGSLECRSS